MDTNKVELSVVPGPAPKIASMTVPTLRSKGDVSILCNLSISTGDSVHLTCFYSIDSGRTYKSTSNVSGKLSGLIASCTDTLVWHTASDYSGEYPGVRFKTVAVGIVGRSDSSATLFFTVDNKPPAFSGLRKTIAATNQVTLSWNPGTDLSLPVTYLIYKATTSGGENYSSADTSTTDTSIIIRNLNNFQNYLFVVRAKDLLGNTDTNRVEFSVTPAAKSAVTSIVTPGTSVKGDVTIKYFVSVPLQDSVSLQCYFSSDSGKTFSATSNVTGRLSGVMSSKMDSLIWHSGTDYKGESPKVQFSITPAGRGGTGNSAISNNLTIDNKPPVFYGLVSAKGDTNSATLSWHPGTDLDGPVKYYVYQSSTKSMGYSSSVATTLDSMIVIPNLQNFQTYFFVVRAQDQVGNIDTNTVTQTAIAVPLSSVARIVAPNVPLRGDVKIRYTVVIPSQDSVLLKCLASVDSGITYRDVTRNVAGRTTNVTLGSTDSLIWHSALDSLPESRLVRFKMVPVGRGGIGDSIATANFTVDNQPPRGGGVNGIQLVGWKSARVILNPATDMSTPIRYNYYFLKNGSRSSSPDTSVASDTLVLSNLPSMADTSFVVRAVDSLGNEDTSTVANKISTRTVGDFDGSVPFDNGDVAQFVSDWSNGDTVDVDMAPWGGSFPKITVKGNDTLNVDDIFVFAKMWTYSHQGSLQSRQSGSAKSAAMVARVDSTIKLNVDRSSRNSELSLGSDVDATLISCGVQIRYGSVHLSNGQALSVDSVSFSGADPSGKENGLLLVYNDTTNKIFYADYGLGSGFDPKGKSMVRLKMKIPKFGEHDSMIVSLVGYDSRVERVLSKDYSVHLADIPSTFALYQNYPNPFNPSTIIQFDLPKAGKVKLEIYNVIGQRVTTLADGSFDAGTYKIRFDAFRYASGVYFYVINTGSNRSAKKMMLLK
jgi:hypothetical protein